MPRDPIPLVFPVRATTAAAPRIVVPAAQPRGVRRTRTAAAPSTLGSRDLLIVGIGTVLLHVVLAATLLAISGRSLDALAQLRDGPSYIRMAGRMLDPSSLLTHFDRRVFIGYPALIALVAAARVPLSTAALVVSWIASGAAAAFAARAFDDRRMGWTLALFPSFLTVSMLAMSEATLLAFVAVGLYCVLRREWRVAGALALGFAGLVRPEACFAVLGLLALFVVQRRWRSALLVAAISAAVVAAGFVALHFWHRDALEGVRIYARDRDEFGGHLLAWPFQSVLLTPWRTAVPLWKIIYVWSYAAFALGGCIIAARSLGRMYRLRVWRRGVLSRENQLALLAAVWLLAATLFVLSTGSVWGFENFPRHILVSLPALLWVCREWTPGRMWSVGAAGACAVALGLAGVLV